MASRGERIRDLALKKANQDSSNGEVEILVPDSSRPIWTDFIVEPDGNLASFRHLPEEIEAISKDDNEIAEEIKEDNIKTSEEMIRPIIDGDDDIVISEEIGIINNDKTVISEEMGILNEYDNELAEELRIFKKIDREIVEEIKIVNQDDNMVISEEVSIINLFDKEIVISEEIGISNEYDNELDEELRISNKDDRDIEEEMKIINQDDYMMISEEVGIINNDEIVISEEIGISNEYDNELDEEQLRISKKDDREIVEEMKIINQDDNAINEEVNQLESQLTDTSDSPDESRNSKKKDTGNKRRVNSEKRLKGHEYQQRNNKFKKGKKIHPNPCLHGKCQNNCGIITNECRKMIFDEYYSMTSAQQQRDFLVSCVSVVDKKRVYSVAEESRRKITKNYFLPVNGIKTKVCLQFLLKTLDISEKVIRYNFENKTIINTAKKEGRGKRPPPNKTPTEISKEVEAFIESIPAVPSHYCRADSTRTYFPADMKNVASLYRLYKKKCDDDKNVSVSEKVFKNIFKSKFNIGFHVPKKDKCVICESFENTPEDCRTESFIARFKKHEEDVKFSKAIHKAAQEKSKSTDESLFICASFDLQKVLNTPHGDSMLLYYSRKYCIYNETFYESESRRGICYLWGEKDGKRGANEICTILLKYLEKVDERGSVKEINLFCDSCPGQNKNHQVLAAIKWFLCSSKTVNEVCITYLQPGHTYMPVDSIHATIENNLKNKIIWAPSEWPTVIVNARSKPEPYEVEIMSHTDFKDFKSLQNEIFPKLKKDALGNILKFTDLKQFTFVKDSDEVRARSSLNPESEEITINLQRKIRGRRQSNVVLQSLYDQELKISSQKYKDLMTLVKNNVIPRRYHSEYLKLKNDNDIPDILPETDEEDDKSFP
jgi:hypothetical protein